MPLVDALLPEFDHETALTRRLLERLPDDRLDYRPHAKSATLRGLATHLGQLGVWGKLTITEPGVDLETMGHLAEADLPPSRAALLDAFDQKMAGARAALAGRTDAELAAAWTLRRGNRTFFTMPKASCWRTFVMNHLIHHRGQLTVYLRELDVPLPSIYGPSADEQPF